MFQIDDVGSMYLSLPPNLQDTENACFSYAFDKQIQKLYKLAKKLTVWSDLDNADPKYYDYMALAIRAPYYKSDYNEKQKLKLIKTTLKSRMYAGTVKAIEELLNHSILCAKFTPWHEYGGEPYHFKIETSDEPGVESKVLFENMLRRVKAARSIIDGVEIDHDPIENISYIGVGIKQMGIVDVKNKEKLEYRLYNSLNTGCTVVIKKYIEIENKENPIENISYIGVGIKQMGIVDVKNKEKPEYRLYNSLYTGCAVVISKQIAIKECKRKRDF